MTAYRGKILRSASLLTALQLASQALLAIELVLVARWGNASSVATTSLFLTISLLAADIFDFGLSLRTTRDLSQKLTDSAEIDGLVATKVAGWTLLVTPICVALSALNHTIVPLCIAIYAPCKAVSYLAQSKAEAESRFLQSGLLPVVERALALAMFVVLTAGSIGLSTSFVVSYTASTAAVALGLLAMSRMPWQLSVRGTLKSLAYGGHYALSVIATDLIALDILIVTLACGFEQAGYFALGARLIGPITILASNCAKALVPIAPELPTVGELLRSRSLSYWAMGIGIVTLLVTSAVPEIIQLSVGPQYDAAAGAVRTYLVAGVLVSVAQPLFVALQTQGDERWVGRMLVVLTLITLAGVLLGALSGGQQGLHLVIWLPQLLDFHWDSFGASHRKIDRTEITGLTS